VSPRQDDSHVVEEKADGFGCTDCPKEWGSGTENRDAARQHESDTWKWKP
jgi:hypothetical protein